MLNIMLGDFNDKCIINVKEHFNLFKETEWFSDPFVRKVIKEVDKSEVIDGEYIQSPVFGGITPERLSSGVKALILMKMEPDLIVYATRCGDNCSPFIVELAEQQELTIMLHHCMTFPEEFTARIVETEKEVHNYEEFIDEFYRYKHEVKGI